MATNSSPPEQVAGTEKSEHLTGNNEKADAERNSDLTADVAADTLNTPSDAPDDTSANTSSPKPEDEVIYPKIWRLILISIALCLSVFCVALDNTIIATAIPHITDQFHALDDVGWYASSYLLSICAVQLLYGKLYSFYSTKWVYICAILLFEVGSLVCAVTPNSVGLILGRTVAGLGAAGVLTGALLIINHSVPLRQRPTYIGFVGSMYGIASVAGPLLGGAFTDRLTWRWCFYINLPLGGVTILFVMAFLHLPEQKSDMKHLSFKEKIQSFDLEGTVLFIPSVVSLLLALQWGGAKYPWRSGRIIGLFVVFAVLIIGFIWVQIWKGDKATVPPRLLKNRSVWSSALFAALLGGAFFVVTYYLPIWFQAVQGSSPVQSGIKNLPMILAVVVSSLLAGGAVSLLGQYAPLMILSAVLAAIGAGLLSTLKVDSGHAEWIAYQFVMGFGIGLGSQQTVVAIQASLKTSDVPIGTAIVIFAQTLGGALLIAIGQNVFQNALVANIADAHIADLDPESVVSVGATQIQTLIPQEYLSTVLHAYNDAVTSTFYVSVAAGALSFFGALAIPWKSVKGKNIEMAAA